MIKELTILSKDEGATRLVKLPSTHPKVTMLLPCDGLRWGGRRAHAAVYAWQPVTTLAEMS